MTLLVSGTLLAFAPADVSGSIVDDALVMLRDGSAKLTLCQLQVCVCCVFCCKF